MIIIILPMMLVGGGNEEVGWRMILQPELEKKFNFNIATIITAFNLVDMALTNILYKRHC